MTCERVIVRVPFRTHYIYDTYAVRFSYFSISGTENQTEPIDFFERKKKPNFSVLNRFSIFSVRFCNKFWFDSVMNTPTQRRLKKRIKSTRR